MSTVAFHTLGCKVNQYETEAITEQFIRCGYEVVDFNKKADIYIINTCTVTNMADQKSRQVLSKARKLNEKAVVVAVGCYVQIAYERLEEVPFVDVLIGNTHKNQVLEIVEKFIETNAREITIEDVHHGIVYEELSINAQQTKTRTAIKIQDGCNQYCSYCIIPYTRGKIRSRDPESVINEVEIMVKNGFKEIILTGIHLGSYGKDLMDVTFIGLIEALNKIENLERIRLGSLEPTLISEEFCERLSKCDKVCPHFHLSMQSGSDSVLERMNRRYTTTVYFEKVELLRKYFENPGFTTDVIVGFPMETEAEADQTYEFIQKVGFSDIHVFKYSIREGTKAAAMKPQVDGTIKTQRSNRLSELGKALKLNYLNGFVGKTETILFEETTSLFGITYNVGYTSRYVKVYVLWDKALTGSILKVDIEGLFEDGLSAQLKQFSI